MNRVQSLIGRFGGQTALAEALGVGQSTVQYWASKGRIPTRWHAKIIAAGERVGVHIAPSDFVTPHQVVADAVEVEPDDALPRADGLPPLPTSPFAKWRGQIDLGGDIIDCYVLDTEQRVIALRSAIRTVTGTDSGNLGSYISAAALKPHLNSDLILGELIEFSIPGTQFKGSGMTTEHFEMICRMDSTTPCEALKSGHRLEVRYHGYNRVVEVHACGITTADNRAMRVWQVRGGSVSNERNGWKVLLLDEAVSFGILNERSQAPRSGYKKGDKIFSRIFCQL